MTTDYSSPGAKARKNETAVLRRLTRSGEQARIAQEMGMTETKVGRFKSADLSGFCLILAHLGLKVVDETEIAISEEKLNAFALLASDMLKSPERVVESLTGRRDE